jgi:hypothetical protein
MEPQGLPSPICDFWISGFEMQDSSDFKISSLSLIPILIVMLLLVDVLAGLVEEVIELFGFLLRDFAVGPGFSLRHANSFFFLDELASFVSRQFAAFHALSNPRFLVLLSTIDRIGCE